MCTLKGRGTSSWELVRFTPLLDQAKKMLQVRHTGQHTRRSKGLFLKDDSDHRRMHVVEQVRGKVRRSEQVTDSRDHSSCLVHGLNDDDVAGVIRVNITGTVRGRRGLRHEIDGSMGIISRDLIGRDIIRRRQRRPSTTPHWLRLRRVDRSGRGRTASGQPAQ